MESAHAESESSIDIEDDCEIDANRSEQLGVHSNESMEYEDEDNEENDSDSESEMDEENDDPSDQDESSSELEDNVTYQDWLEEAKGATEEMWTEKYEKYLNENMGRVQAKEKANRKTLWAVKRIFFNKYKEFLTHYLFLEDNVTHQEIVEDLKEKTDKGMIISKAFNRIMPKHQGQFEGLFQQDEEDDNQEDGDD